MFKFFRKKLKEAVSKITKEIDEKAEEAEETIEVKPEEKEEKIEEKKPKEKKGFFSKLKEKFMKKEVEKPKKEEKKIEKPKKEEPKVEEKKEEKPKVEEKKEEPKEVPREEPKKEELKEVPKEEKPKVEEEKEEKKSEEIIKEEKEKKKEEPKEEKLEESVEEKKEEPKKKSFFAAIKEKITTKKLSESQFENIFWNLEVVLMENNVAVEVISKIKEDLKNNIVEKSIIRSKIEKTIEDSLKKSIKDLFKTKQFDLLTKVKEKKPFVICFIGINGSGKTTTIAKIAKLLQDNNLSCVLAASDTFRAASIEQLQKHADNLGIKLIKHDYGSDPAAVAYDAIEHAKSKNLDVVLIDTAGRMHSNINLADEMKKIVRVSKPDLKIFVGEAITGNDCIEQAKTFNEAIDIDAIILAKADVDEKGGAAVSVSYVIKKPIIYLGTGQNYEDIKKFDSDIILNNLGLT